MVFLAPLLRDSHSPLGFRVFFLDFFFSLPSLSVQRQVETSVRSKILYLIQAWAHAFRNEPKYKVVQDTYQIMKVEGEDSVGKGGWTIGQAALLWRSLVGEGMSVRTLLGVSKFWTCSTELFLGAQYPMNLLE